MSFFFLVGCLRVERFSILPKSSAFWATQFVLCSWSEQLNQKALQSPSSKLMFFFFGQIASVSARKLLWNNCPFIQGDLYWERGPLCFIILKISLTGKGLCSALNGHHHPILGFSLSPFNLLNSLLFPLGEESCFLKWVEADTETQNQRT